MTSVKHQPATPLPWQQDGDSTRVSAPSMRVNMAGATYFAAQGGAPSDAAYIAHAANAYPKLVEALRGIALRHADGTLCFDGCEKAGLVSPSPFCERYQGILRDLGETE